MSTKIQGYFYLTISAFELRYHHFWFSLGMEEHGLTLEQIEAVPAVNREISSVRIREIDDSSSNPEPIVQGEEADLLLEEFLSPTKLVRNEGHAPEFIVTMSLFELSTKLPDNCT